MNMTEYKLIPMSEITDEARELAVLWSENMKDDFISQKHKLASDIMNYAESLAKERAVEVLREMINKKKAEFESLKESAPHSNDSMRSCRIGIVTLLSAIEEMNDTFFAEKRKEGAE